MSEDDVIYPVHPNPEMEKEYTIEQALKRIESIVKRNKQNKKPIETPESWVDYIITNTTLTPKTQQHDNTGN